jgi:GNAT superfamily N-acetyltransferase
MRDGDLAAAVDLLMLTSASDVRHGLTAQLAAMLDGDTPGAFPEQPYAVVAEQDGVIIGAANAAVEPTYPGTVSVLVAVAEEARGHGVGSALAALLHERISTADLSAVSPPLDTLTCKLRDDLSGGSAFAERNGFVVGNHSVGWRFDLSGRQEELTALAARTAGAAGVTVRRADLHEELSTIAECVSRCMAGLPAQYRADQEVDLEHARELVPDEATILLAESHEGAVPVALGVTILTPQRDAGSWYTVFTGVVADQRGRGVATAVKTASLLFALRAGARVVVTHNDDSNAAIIRLNKSLGMTPAGGYWGMARGIPAA